MKKLEKWRVGRRGIYTLTKNKVFKYPAKLPTEYGRGSKGTLSKVWREEPGNVRLPMITHSRVVKFGKEGKGKEN